MVRASERARPVPLCVCVCVFVPRVTASAGLAPRPGVRVRVAGSGAGTAGREGERRRGWRLPAAGRGEPRALLSSSPSGADPAAPAALRHPGVFPAVPRSPCGNGQRAAGRGRRAGLGSRPPEPRSPSEGLGLGGAVTIAQLHPDVGALLLLLPACKQMSSPVWSRLQIRVGYGQDRATPTACWGISPSGCAQLPKPARVNSRGGISPLPMPKAETRRVKRRQGRAHQPGVTRLEAGAMEGGNFSGRGLSSPSSDPSAWR